MVSLAFAGVGQIVRLCLISGESASARTHCLLGPHASCPASQAIRVRIEQVPDMIDQTRPGGPAPRSREALPPESERRCGGEPTVQEGGGDPSIKKKTPTVLGIQQSQIFEVPAENPDKEPTAQAGSRVRDQMRLHVEIDVLGGATNSVVLRMDVIDATRSASVNLSSAVLTRVPRLLESHEPSLTVDATVPSDERITHGDDLPAETVKMSPNTLIGTDSSVYQLNLSSAVLTRVPRLLESHEPSLTVDATVPPDERITHGDDLPAETVKMSPNTLIGTDSSVYQLNLSSAVLTRVPRLLESHEPSLTVDATVPPDERITHGDDLPAETVKMSPNTLIGTDSSVYQLNLSSAVLTRVPRLLESHEPSLTVDATVPSGRTYHAWG